MCLSVLLLPSSGQVCIAVKIFQKNRTVFLHFALLPLAYFSAWLTSYEDPAIEIINQRIEDITGLEVDTAEELQVEFKLSYSEEKLNYVPSKLHFACLEEDFCLCEIGF